MLAIALIVIGGIVLIFVVAFASSSQKSAPAATPTTIGSKVSSSTAAVAPTSSTSAAPVTTASPTTDTRPGSPEVYRRIDAMTTCAETQAEFDIAMENVNRRQPGDPYRALSLTYAEYANAKQKSLGC